MSSSSWFRMSSSQEGVSSMVQSLAQPSPLEVLPSSHSSVELVIPSPQTGSSFDDVHV